MFISWDFCAIKHVALFPLFFEFSFYFLILLAELKFATRRLRCFFHYWNTKALSSDRCQHRGQQKALIASEGDAADADDAALSHWWLARTNSIELQCNWARERTTNRQWERERERQSLVDRWDSNNNSKKQQRMRRSNYTKCVGCDVDSDGDGDVAVVVVNAVIALAYRQFESSYGGGLSICHRSSQSSFAVRMHWVQFRSGISCQANGQCCKMSYTICNLFRNNVKKTAHYFEKCKLIKIA